MRIFRIFISTMALVLVIFNVSELNYSDLSLRANF